MGFNELADRLASAGLFDSDLSGDSDTTLFAPTDAAFQTLISTHGAALQANPDMITTILRNHIVTMKILMENISDGSKVTNLAGNEITAGVNDGETTIGGAGVDMTKANLPVLSVTIHTLNDVILQGITLS